MKLKKLLSLVLSTSLCVSLAACGTRTDTNGTEKQAAAPEQKITVYMPSPAGLSDKLCQGFEKKAGIKVEKFQGTTGEILARLEAEKSNPVADVVILASWSDGLSMKQKGELQSYRPSQADALVNDWIDGDNQLVGYSASAAGIIYNTNITPELNADWDELANPRYRGMLAIPDPEKSGACKDFLAGYVNKNGWNTFQALAENGMKIPGANKAAMEAVTTGEVGILVAGVDYNAYEAIKKGEPLAIYYPKSGTIINPRPAMIMKNAPDTENAKKFMDYLLSDEAQQLIANAFLIPGRRDIKAKGTPLESIPQITPEWDNMMAIAADTAKKLNNLCK
ncbi:MAG: ABC transporter substrate-binding protein [Megasphaera sp.]|jgi:iron(III) transport system substrate-binding protein|nr:ABC transporter substrate-binding protein [Megasphaera sp.]MCI1247436.1 ABC transporter substrate-binding protein [Megasphaera sp.]